MIFFGTSEFSLHVLDKLLELGLKPSHIVTVPDKPQGRKLLITPPPAKIWAERNDIPYFQFEKLNAEAIAELQKLEPDIFLVASYGKIIPQAVLDIPKLGAINIHPSLLPKYRGATPLQSSILADDSDTGVTLMCMDDKMDHGNIISVKKLENIQWPPALSELEYTLARSGAELAFDYIKNPSKFNPIEQNHSKATYTKKITKEDGLINANNLSDKEGRIAYLKYKALEGWPGVYFFINRKDKTIRVSVKEAYWNEARQELELLRVTPEGKKEMSLKDFNNFLQA